MKYLLIFLAGLFLVWRWRNARTTALQSQRQRAAPITTPMVACRQCGVHLPESDAVVGTHGAYCSIAHRLHMEP